ncbi:ABC transporter ATP-binding protein [Acidomonas methanolica]|uniref:ABC transporter multidrug resistance n=1 Tax=Acidomonas methanolica NBRC 104435 TaxID=1231351 RepID=A0A023D1T9_ACIMT|nr:ATP-binding cassette subfamily B protein [Acidomonas methanolica]GAJ28113.1 ABC transporter multidrug resistance [Acidomonas methanolica NBRC 104435]GEK98687.1 multidrug ABC transporter ATP-binding protein [Acidomonas methanolica NBRC 104435]
MSDEDESSEVTSAAGARNRKREVSFTGILAFVARCWVEHPGPFARTLLGVAMATAMDIVMPLLAGRLVRDVSRHAGGVPHDAAQAAVLHDAALSVAGLIALGLGGLLGRRLSFIGITHLTLRIMNDVASRAFARVQRFSTDWHANSFAGSTVRKLTRGIWAIDMINDTMLLLIVPEIIVLGGTTLVLALHSLLMGAVLAVSVVLFVWLSITLTLRYVAPSARASNRWDTKMGAAMADAITCNAVVKAFGAEAREDRRLARTLRIWGLRTERSWVRGTNSGNLQNFASLVMRMLLIALSVWLWWEGKAGPGDVAYVLTMVFLVQGYLRDLGQQVSQLQRAINEAEELVAIFRHEPEVLDRPDAVPARFTHGAIRFEHVRFQYPGQKTPLYQDLELDITPGSRVALVGPSGSGKTTLTKLLQRLYDVSGGRITIDGVDVRSVTQDSLRAHIAIVPQEPLLFHRSLAENIAYGRPGATQSEIAEAARQANAAGFIERLPDGYATLVGERGVKLSGGERQRVAIARAFLADAPILIFDEATSSLDSESEALVQDAMHRLMMGRTVIVIAHRLATVMELDRILVFSHGEVREDGSHAELVRQEGGIYRRLFELQSLDG